MWSSFAQHYHHISEKTSIVGHRHPSRIAKQISPAISRWLFHFVGDLTTFSGPWAPLENFLAPSALVIVLKYLWIFSSIHCGVNISAIGYRDEFNRDVFNLSITLVVVGTHQVAAPSAPGRRRAGRPCRARRRSGAPRAPTAAARRARPTPWPWSGASPAPLPQRAQCPGFSGFDYIFNFPSIIMWKFITRGWEKNHCGPVSPMASQSHVSSNPSLHLLNFLKFEMGASYKVKENIVRKLAQACKVLQW